MVECVSPPLLPVRVSVELPSLLVALVVIVRVDEVDAGRLTGLTLNDPVEPDGRPDTLRLTAPLKPLVAASVTVYLAVPPATTATLEGEAVIVKSGGGTVTTM